MAVGHFHSLFRKAATHWCGSNAKKCPKMARYKRLHPKDCADDEKAGGFCYGVFCFWVVGWKVWKKRRRPFRKEQFFLFNLLVTFNREPDATWAPKWWFTKGNPLISTLFQGNLGWWNIMIWPESWFSFFERFVRVFRGHMHVMFMHHSCCAHVLFIRRSYAVDFSCSIFPVNKYLRTTRSVVIHVSWYFKTKGIVFQPAFLKDHLLVFVGVSQ